MYQTVILTVILFCSLVLAISELSLAHFNEDPQNEEVNKTFPELLLLSVMHFY